MTFYLIGADYKTLSLEAREALYKQRKSIIEFWAAHAFQQAAMLATCNRIEIYGVAKDYVDAERYIWLFRSRFPVFSVSGYAAFGERDVFKHALRVACGLESQLKGELEILQQLEAWCKHDSFPLAIRELIQKTICAGREIRHRAGLNLVRHNVATIVLDDITRNHVKDDDFEAVILGTGKIAELFSVFSPKQAHIYFAAHRNFSKAKLLAQAIGGEAISLKEMAHFIAKVDVVISATRSPHFVLGQNTIAQIILKREKPLYLYDLGIPRDIDPKAGLLPGVVLQNLDDLQPLFEEYNALIRNELNAAEYLCEEAIKSHQEAVYA